MHLEVQQTGVIDHWDHSISHSHFLVDRNCAYLYHYGRKLDYQWSVYKNISVLVEVFMYRVLSLHLCVMCSALSQNLCCCETSICHLSDQIIASLDVFFLERFFFRFGIQTNLCEIKGSQSHGYNMWIAMMAPAKALT